MQNNVNYYYKAFMDDRAAYCSIDTLSYYSANLGKFMICLSQYYDLPITEISPDMITSAFLQFYIRFLRSKNISNVSVQTYFRAVRVFCCWLSDHKYMKRDVLMDVKTPKAYPAEKIPLTVEEVEKLDLLFDLSTEKGLRNYLIFHLMLDCGLRRSEVVGLNKSDILDENMVLSVVGKGTKHRFVPLPDALHMLLKQYIDRYNTDQDCVFLNLTGEREPLTINTIKQFFKDFKVESGIDRLHPHLLRHTFATSYILGGGNVEFLRILLGHSDIKTTQNYMHISSNCRILNIDVYRLDSVFFRYFTYR